MAIAFAVAALEEAEYAVLDAELARIDADEQQASMLRRQRIRPRPLRTGPHAWRSKRLKAAISQPGLRRRGHPQIQDHAACPGRRGFLKAGHGGQAQSEAEHRLIVA